MSDDNTQQANPAFRAPVGSAFTAGYIAARDGAKPGDNPHDERAQDFWSWMAGWAEYHTQKEQSIHRRWRQNTKLSGPAGGKD